MARKKVSNSDIARLVDLPGYELEYRANLYRSLSMPSYVHGYSLAIEYMRSWFVNKFRANLGEDYFKCIHVNGKHVLDDWKHFNNYNIRREKPMLAIVPAVDYDHDRESIDLYLADENILLKRSHQEQAFLKDYKNQVYLGMQLKEMKMNFGFKIRIGSRAEQQWLYNHMEIWFRIGATQTNYISADFHVPYDIMINIAYDLNFDVDVKNNKIKNISEFVSYLNQRSDHPFIFKMRAINQKQEFFIRIRDIPVHIATKDKLGLDDGERVGRLDDNFHIEMQAILTIPVPFFYVYFSRNTIHKKISVRDDEGYGIYTINAYEIPPENNLGWDQFVQTSYLCQKDEQCIDISELFEGTGNVNDILKYSLSQYINPSNFIDIIVLHTKDTSLYVPFKMDFNNMSLILEEPIESEELLNIVVYVDKRYINETIINLNNYSKNRFETE